MLATKLGRHLVLSEVGKPYYASETQELQMDAKNTGKEILANTYTSH